MSADCGNLIQSKHKEKLFGLSIKRLVFRNIRKRMTQLTQLMFLKTKHVKQIESVQF